MFRLYAQERAIFTFDDYQALMDECHRLGAHSALEFGPGASTLALVEAGLDRIVTLEHDPKWRAIATERCAAHPQVRVLAYSNARTIDPKLLAGEALDLAFVDSPVGIEARSAQRFPGQENCSRLNTTLFALDRAPVALLHDAKRPGERETLRRVAALGHKVSMIDTVKGIARIERK